MTASNRPALIVLCAASISLALPGRAAAQSRSAGNPSWEVFGALGWGCIRCDSDTVGPNGPIIGGGVIVRSRSGWGAVFETAQILSKATMVTGSLQYYFRGDRRVQPYLSAGVGANWVKRAAMREERLPESVRSRLKATNLGFGYNVGAGVRAAIDGRVSVRFDAQQFASCWLLFPSSLNLAVSRLSASAGVSR